MVTETVIAADLIGGPASGQRVTLPGERHVFRMPVRLPLTSIFGAWTTDPDTARPVPLPFATYRRCGIRDDGRRIYAYDARCSNA